MEVFRTPDPCFDDLPDYPFPPNYAVVDDGQLRMHYVEAGPASGEPVLCLHGQPSWSYLYRKMIPVLAEAGYRVIAPDLVGFGRSDKPAAIEDYSYARHVRWVTEFLQTLGLDRLTLIAQDWGGLIGLRVVAEDPQRFSRIVLANTSLPDAKGITPDMAQQIRKRLAATPALGPDDMDAKVRENVDGLGFLHWIKYCTEYPDFRISDALQLYTRRELTAAELRAYDAPFPDESYKQGARAFPGLVPILPDDPAVPDNRRAWTVLEQFTGPFLTAFSDDDPYSAGADRRFRQAIPGTYDQNHVTIHGPSHFLQEDAGEMLAELIVGFCRANPLDAGGR